jgi:DNA-binding transcriptional ArsR family regulator
MEEVIILKALADETRVGIVRFLLSGEKNAGEIVKHMKKSQPNTSLAIKQLLMTSILLQEKQGREIYYRIKRPESIRKVLRALEELGR